MKSLKKILNFFLKFFFNFLKEKIREILLKKINLQFFAQLKKN